MSVYKNKKFWQLKVLQVKLYRIYFCKVSPYLRGNFSTFLPSGSVILPDRARPVEIPGGGYGKISKSPPGVIFETVSKTAECNAPVYGVFLGL